MYFYTFLYDIKSNKNSYLNICYNYIRGVVDMRNDYAKEIENKGFLPINSEYNEVPHDQQENVENNPKQYIIEECIPACQELWSKNIYTFMVSDHLNEGQCWIELFDDALSDENMEIYDNLFGEDMIKFNYHRGCICFGVSCVGIEGQQKLLQLAKQFNMQDVPKKLAYIDEEDFLRDYCDCYIEYENPNYKYMAPFWEVNLSREESAEYIKAYQKWESSDESKSTLKRFAPEKAIKSTFTGEECTKHKLVTKEIYILRNVVQSFANKLYVKRVFLKK